MDADLEESSPEDPVFEPFRITSPENGEELTRRDVSISGRGGLPFFIHVRKIQADGSQTLLGITYPNVSPGGPWATLPISFRNGPHKIIAVIIGVDGQEYPSDPITFSVTVPLDAPVIVVPDANSVQKQTFTVSGVGGWAGATIEILRDLGEHIVIGTGPVKIGGSWDVTITVPPGSFSLVAEQFMGGEHSGRSQARGFKIRPPQLETINTEFLTTPVGSVKFSGSGHNGATVEITVVSGPGGTAPPAVQVSNSRWETTATDWKFGTYTLKAIQKVSDNANGWIESQPYTFAVSRLFPDPYDVKFTTDYQPTFSGKGYTGATVILYNPGGASKAAPDARVSDGIWSSRASEVWGPTFEREVHIQQTLNGQTSPNWVKPKVTIPPLAPVMNEPVENGLSPQLSGTCWPGATLSLRFSGSSAVHPVPNNNGTWSFRRDLPFEPEITHNALITQTAARQTSPAASKTFTVDTPIPKPVITSPAANSEVGRDMTVQGTSGMKGATMQLRDAQFGRDLGEPKLLTVDGAWSIDLIDLGFRQYTVDAQQTRNQRPSVRSEPRAFNVVLLPPVITLPMENGDLPRTATLWGSAMPDGRVTVRLEGIAEPLLTDIPVGADGRWKGEVTLPVGAKTIWAQQTFDRWTSKDSQRLNYNVVPAAPLIETPATDEHIGRRVVVSGFGVPGDSVTVRLGDATHSVLGRSPVLEDRTWSVTVEFDQPGGLYPLLAVASCDGFDSADSAARPVVLGTYQPPVDAPAQGQWVSHPVGFKGRGRPGVGQVVSWFSPDQVWVSDLPVTGGAWLGEAQQSLPRGGQWCRFRQSITDGADGATVSDWVESNRFESVPPVAEP